jgi:nicotinate-nucleotide adenylyltransferase
MDHKDIQKSVYSVFQENFGRTPLKARLDDIMGETLELIRYTDMKNLREEFGDLLATVIAGIEENGWDMETLLSENRDKIYRRQKQYLSLGRKIKVAILGGAFDCITEGHIAVAQFVLNTSKTFDEVWLMPCYQHMYNKEMTSPEHRIAMCRLAAARDGRIKVSDYEIKSQLRGETYNLVNRLQDEPFAKDHYDFSMIIGQDNANTFHEWVNYEHLERLIRFVVVPRKGVSPAEGVNWFMNSPHISLHGETTIPEISSTEIRHNLDTYWKTGSKTVVLNDMLHPDVFEYIKKNELYKGENNG